MLSLIPADFPAVAEFSTFSFLRNAFSLHFSCLGVGFSLIDATPEENCYVYVDGDSVGEITDEELEKRRILGTEGFVSSFVVVDTETADVITGPKIYLNAVAEDESEFDKVRHQIVEQLQDAMMQGTRDTYKLQQIMRRTLGGWVARQLHRKPMIVPVVADIAQDVDDAMGLNAAK